MMRSVSDKISIEYQDSDKILVEKLNPKENFDSKRKGQLR